MAEPNTGKLSKIAAAASLLAPEPLDANNFVYERKDDSSGNYAGSSLGLAYFLALVSRSRSLIGRCKGEMARNALYALSQIGGPTVSKGLVGMLSGETDLAMKAAIAKALGQLRDSKARDGLMEELAFALPAHLSPLRPESR